MNDFHLATPVALTIFNRPNTTRMVFAEIAKAKPPLLLIVADGPRTDRAEEAGACAAAREIVEDVDWDCEVLTNFSEVNLGCKQRISSGLDWVFHKVEEAIILEDDCVPHPTFFRFCEELLHRYRHDERIMMVAGNNFGLKQERHNDGYCFSRYASIWGWATWRRAWKHYDVDMKMWPVIRDGNLLRDILGDSRAAACWADSFEGIYEGPVDTWDVQWEFACWIQRGLTILPCVNLVSNVGFDAQATHTKSTTHRQANMPVQAMAFPLRHLPFVIRDARVDDFIEKSVFHVPVSTVLTRAIPKVGRFVSHLVSRRLAE